MDVTINVLCVTCGVTKQRSFETGVPGLVVGRNCNHNGEEEHGGEWIITHVSTGRHLGYFFDGPEQAMSAASLLQGIDWTADMIDDATRLEAGRRTKVILGPRLGFRPTGIPITVVNPKGD